MENQKLNEEKRMFEEYPEIEVLARNNSFLGENEEAVCYY